MSDNLCIYHKNCLDGFTAAWVVNKALNGDCEFHPANYNEPFPNIGNNKNIYIVDFSYPRSVLIEMAIFAKKIVVLDHHKTAKEDLSSKPFPISIQNKLQIIFDMERSGAMITWNYFFPNQPAPYGIESVQDRDLWRFKLGKTKEYNAYLFSKDMTFENWDELMVDKNFVNFVARGETLLEKHNKDVKQFAELTETTLHLDFGKYDYVVPCCNILPNLASDVGAYLIDKYPYAPFVATFYYTKSTWNFSLRSREGREDVSAIAKHYGGGGHRNASGFHIGLSYDIVNYSPIFRPDGSVYIPYSKL